MPTLGLTMDDATAAATFLYAIKADGTIGP
jgi:hypothetical protein